LFCDAPFSPPTTSTTPFLSSQNSALIMADYEHDDYYEDDDAIEDCEDAMDIDEDIDADIDEVLEPEQSDSD
jgi:hypothetical protein